MSKYEKKEEDLVNKVSSVLLQALKDYEQPVDITDGYSFNFKETINKIELYIASKFRSGDIDSQGNKKYFFNIVNPQCGNATKNIDLDRKDVRVRAGDGNDYVKSMIYNSELKQWMRNSKFGITLNKISDRLPKYGSVILKKQGSDIKFVPLKWIKFDPAISNKDGEYDIQSSYVIEEHYLQPHELRAKVKDGWDSKEVDYVIKKVREKEDKTSLDTLVYEIHADFESEVFGLKEGYTRGRVYLATGTEKDSVTKKENSWYCILYTEVEESFPYKKLDYFTIEGRGLGLGIIEMLFDPQQRWNEMANQKATAMQISSKHLFQTKDDTAEGNILTDLLNGDLVKVKSEITPIATEERNLGAYTQEENNINYIIRSNANAQEILTGDTLPSGTPFRLGALINQNAGKLFEFIRENIGLFLEEVITEWVLPDFEKDVTMEHIFETYDQDVIDLILERDANKRINNGIAKYVLNTGKYPPKDLVQTIKDSELSDKPNSLFLKVIKGLLKFDKKVEIDITGEQTNVAQRVETISNLLQLLAQNPTIITNPQTEKLFKRMLEDVGLTPNLIGNAPLPAMNQLGGAGLGNVPLAK